MPTPNHRLAQTGDIFILLVPVAQDLQLLRQKQAELQAQCSGQIVDHVHITCQRFTLNHEQIAATCIATLAKQIGAFAPFPVFSDGLVQFRAPYWQTHVLRWRIQETEAWKSFRQFLDQSLAKHDCPSHFSRQRHSTCTTLSLDAKVNPENYANKISFPFRLFTAREVVISQLTDDNCFAVLETIELEVRG